MFQPIQHFPSTGPSQGTPIQKPIVQRVAKGASEQAIPGLGEANFSTSLPSKLDGHQIEVVKPGLTQHSSFQNLSDSPHSSLYFTSPIGSDFGTPNHHLLSSRDSTPDHAEPGDVWRDVLSASNTPILSPPATPDHSTLASESMNESSSSQNTSLELDASFNSSEHDDLLNNSVNSQESFQLNNDPLLDKEIENDLSSARKNIETNSQGKSTRSHNVSIEDGDVFFDTEEGPSTPSVDSTTASAQDTISNNSQSDDSENRLVGTNEVPNSMATPQPSSPPPALTTILKQAELSDQEIKSLHDGNIVTTKRAGNPPTFTFHQLVDTDPAQAAARYWDLNNSNKFIDYLDSSKTTAESLKIQNSRLSNKSIESMEVNYIIQAPVIGAIRLKLKRDLIPLKNKNDVKISWELMEKSSSFSKNEGFIQFQAVDPSDSSNKNQQTKTLVTYQTSVDSPATWTIKPSLTENTFKGTFQKIMTMIHSQKSSSDKNILSSLENHVIQDD